MNAKALAFALSAVTLTATADDKIYTVNDDTTGPIDLVAEGCVTDRIQFGTKAENKIKHAVIGATGTSENPFTVVGNYSGYVWESSGLLNLHFNVHMDRPEATVFLRNATGGGGNYYASDTKSLSVTRGTLRLSDLYLNLAGRERCVITVGPDSTLHTYRIEPQTNSQVNVVNGGKLITSLMNISSCLPDQPAVLNISNATVQVTELTCQLANGAPNVVTADVACKVILDEEGVLRTPSVDHYRGPKTEIAFKGGKLVADRSLAILSSGVDYRIRPYFFNQAGSGPVSLNAESGPIVLDIPPCEYLPDGYKFMNDIRDKPEELKWQGPMYLTGDQGFVKRGAGTLTMNKGETGSIFMQVTGGVCVEGGVLRRTSAYSFDRANALTVAEGAAYDLNGCATTFASLHGTGAVVSSGEAATLTITDAAASTFGGRLGGNVTLDTADGARLAFSHLSVDGSDLGATIKHFKLAADGVLDLTLPKGMTVRDFVGQSEVPLLSVADIEGEGNLESWTVKINGKVVRSASLCIERGALCLRKVPGLIMLFK